MPVLGSRWPSFEHKRFPEADGWETVSDVEIRQTLTKLVTAYQISPTETLSQQIDNAAEALTANRKGQPVELLVDPSDGDLYFATGPRYVPEDELFFTLNQVIGRSSYIVNDVGRGRDLNDEAPRTAIRNALIDSGLLVKTTECDRYDSFSDQSQFESVITCALEQWEMDLADSLLPDDEKRPKSACSRPQFIFRLQTDDR